MERLLMQPKQVTLKAALEALRLAETRLSVALNWITRNYSGKLPVELQGELRRVSTAVEVDNTQEVHPSTVGSTNYAETGSPMAEDEFGSDNSEVDADTITSPLLKHEPEHSSCLTSRTSRVNPIKVVDIRSITEKSQNSFIDVNVKQEPDWGVEHTCRHCLATFESIPALSVHCLVHAQLRLVRLNITKNNLEEIVKEPRLFSFRIINDRKFMLIKPTKTDRGNPRRGVSTISSDPMSLRPRSSLRPRPGPRRFQRDQGGPSYERSSSPAPSEGGSSDEPPPSEHEHGGSGPPNEHGSNGPPPIDPELLALVEVECELCKRKFPTKLHLKCHTDFEHQPRVVDPCQVCGIHFPTSKERTAHVRIEHPELLTHKCSSSNCEWSFLSKSALQSHIKHVHPDSSKSWPCEVCGKVFKTQLLVKNHLNRNHPDPSLAVPCPTCGIQLKNASALKSHVVMHASRSFLCQTCGHATKSQHQLNMHMKWAHSTLRPLPCPHCTRTFKLNHSLKRHIKCHTGQNIKACPHCGIMKAESTMHNHIRIVHLGRKFKCSQCPAMFSLRAHLKNHFKLKHPDVAIPPDSELEVIFTKTLNDASTSTPVPSHSGSHSNRPKPKHSRSSGKKNDRSHSDLSCATCDGAVFHSHDDFTLHMLRHENDPDYKMRRRLPVPLLEQAVTAASPTESDQVSVQDVPQQSDSLSSSSSSASSNISPPPPSMPAPPPLSFEQMNQPVDQPANWQQHSQFTVQPGGTAQAAQYQQQHPYNLFMQQPYNPFPSYPYL